MSERNWERDWDSIIADERYEAYERDADRIEDARREEIDERMVTCDDCGNRWVPGGSSCPECGGSIAGEW